MDAIHRLVIGDAQCARHQLFAELGIRMVDGESVRREFYPRDCVSLGCEGAAIRRSHGEVGGAVYVEVSWKARTASARGWATRRRSFAATSRVQFQWWVRIFGRNRKPARRQFAGDGVRAISE